MAEYYPLQTFHLYTFRQYTGVVLAIDLDEKQEEKLHTTVPDVARAEVKLLETLESTRAGLGWIVYQPFFCLLDEPEDEVTVELSIKSDQDQVICLDRHQTEE